MKQIDHGTGLLFVGGLASAAAGQFYFAYRREYVWDGVLFWAVAVVLLGLALRRVKRLERGTSEQGPGAGLGLVSLLREHPHRVIAAGGGLALSFFVGWEARSRPPDAEYVDLLAVWAIGVSSYLLAFCRALPSLRELRQRLAGMGGWIRRNRLGLTGMALLLLLALLLRAYDLEHIPSNFGGDEGTWAMEGLAMLDGQLANPFNTRWFAFPSMSFLVWGLSMRAFGDTVAGVRAVSALIGAAAVMTTFLLAWELWNRRVAWLAGVALAVGHYHVHFSRLAVNNIADTLLVTSALYLLVRGLRRRSLALLALAGAAMGAGWYGYFGARLVGILATLYLAWRAAAEHRFLARHGRALFALLGAGLVVSAPLIIFYAEHPTVVTEGLNRVSIFASGWLRREHEITGRSFASLMVQQFWRSISAFHYTLDPTFWYRAQIPLLDAVSGILFVLGMVWCFGRWRWRGNGLLLIWFWSALVTGWVMTENPPSSQRMVIVTPALAIIVALGVERLLRLGEAALGRRPALRTIFVGAMVATLVGLNMGYYYFVYTPTRVYANVTAEIATRLARSLASHDDDYIVYFYGAPFMYWDYGALRFMARGEAGVDVPPQGEGEVVQPDFSRGARFVFHPARVDELEAIRARYPGGTSTEVRSDADGKLLYGLYEVAW